MHAHMSHHLQPNSVTSKTKTSKREPLNHDVVMSLSFLTALLNFEAPVSRSAVRDSNSG